MSISGHRYGKFGHQNTALVEMLVRVNREFHQLGRSEPTGGELTDSEFPETLSNSSDRLPWLPIVSGSSPWAQNTPGGPAHPGRVGRPSLASGDTCLCASRP
jgi:hypothetical protein